MDRRNIHTIVDVTGGFGQGVVDAVRKYHTPHPDRFIIFTEPWYPRSNQPGYPQFQADAIVKAHKAGAKVGLCGQAPSDHPEFAEFLVECGIDSMSVTPDSFVAVRRRVARAEGAGATRKRA